MLVLLQQLLSDEVFMPMPYSHYVVAQSIADRAALPISNASDYYVGAFYPDVRYFTKLPREKYHFPSYQVDDLTAGTNTSLDFSLGYKVHLLIDEVWEEPEIAQTYKRAFPLPIQSRMTRNFQALAFEMYCLRQPVRVVELQPVENDFIRSLNVTRAHTEQAVTSMQRYLQQHDLEAALAMARETELFPEARLKTVEGVVSRLKNPFLKVLVNAFVARASRPTFEGVVSTVAERLEASA